MRTPQMSQMVPRPVNTVRTTLWTGPSSGAAGSGATAAGPDGDAWPEAGVAARVEVTTGVADAGGAGGLVGAMAVGETPAGAVGASVGANVGTAAAGVSVGKGVLVAGAVVAVGGAAC
jgi:hypothetical protein